MPPPDAVALVVEYLRGQELMTDVTVATGRPQDVSGQVPVLLVESIGEPHASRLPWARSVRLRIGMQVWAAPGSAEALKVMRGALTALLAARRVRLVAGGRIDRVDQAAEPIEVPDRRVGDDVHRIVATVDVIVRA